MVPVRKRAGWGALAAAVVVAAGATLATTSAAVGLRTRRTTTNTTSAQPADTPAPTPPANALKRWAATNGGGAKAQSPTLAQALAVAHNYSLVLATKNSYPPYVAQMRQANPALKLVVYTNGVYAQSDQGSAYPDAWYARAADGSKVRSKKYGNYLMDPTSTGWIQSRAQTCAQWAAATHYDGCYLDMLGNATMGAGYDTAAPINPSTHQPWTSTQWIAATSNLATTVVNANPTLLVVGNGLANGNQYFDPASGPTSTLLNSLAGANAQGFIRSESDAVTSFRSVSAWKNDVDMLVNAGPRGRFVMAMTKVDGKGTADQVQQIHRYALASFLLGTNGTQYFFFSPSGNDDGVNAPDTPDDHVNPGAPSAAYQALANGAYVRPFTGGYVAVNPTAATVTVNLGTTYVDLDGHAVQQAVLAPHSGMVFTSPSTVTTPSTPGSTTTTSTPACKPRRSRRCTPRRAP
ncbi:MAG: hypothetical protein JO155_04810 [Acidimicrobiia bacterium]|nr:hypothetical protein [Acidimicrobiia bacterium]